MKIDITIEYYNQNADAFASGIANVDFTEVQDKFLSYIPSGAYILDFGCGFGRDTKYFLNKGFQVDASDGSEELCKIAGKTAGISIKQMLFSELNENEKYDGIWACSSILHLPKDELKDVMDKMLRATKNGGCIYISFKYGESEGYRNGRYFIDFTEEGFAGFLRGYPQLKIIEEWVSGDVHPGRGDEKPEIPKLFEACYLDNLHSIWAGQKLYRKGNTQEEFYNILQKNMQPVYDSARRQGYEIWNRG